MNILQLTPKMPFPPKDGGAIAAWNLTTGLRANGHRLILLAMNTDKHYIRPEHLPAEVLQIAEWHPVKVDTKVRWYKGLWNLFFSRMPYNLERFRSEEFGRKLSEILQKEKIDIVHCEGLPTCLYIPVIRKYSKAKISYRAHNIEWEIWERKAIKEMSLLKKQYFKIIATRIRQFETKLMNRFDLLIPITSRDEEILASMGNRTPSCVIPSGMDPNNINHHPLPSVFRSIAYIGALDWTPNQEGLVWFLEKVWAPFSREHRNITFHIAGRNAPRWLVKVISNYSGISYEGEVDESSSFISAHPVFVVPLFSGSGMRVKIIEAMSLGRIVLSSPLGAEGLPVHHGKNILIASRAMEFIEMMDQMAWSLEKNHPLAENAVKLIREEFNNKLLTSKLAAFFDTHLS